MSIWLREAAAIFAKDWRSEFRTRIALNTLGLFAVSTLVVVSFSLGPLGTSPLGVAVLPAVLWIILLFAATAGLPRLFVAEEETHTATALRLAARPTALFCGKLLYGCALILALEALTVPLFLTMVQLPVVSPGRLILVLLAGGLGLAAGSTLVAAMVAQARGRGTLFAVLAFPVLIPLLIIAVALTREAVGGEPVAVSLTQLLVYDGSVVVAGFMLFPPLWNP
ncbi:MAG: heme exporter protein CcmB [Acidobacteriota bacterium]